MREGLLFIPFNMQKPILMKTLTCMLSALALCACTGRQGGLPAVDIPGAETVGKPFDLSEIAWQVEYVPLETNDSVRVETILDLDATEDYIFIVTDRSDRPVLQFDRRGRFVRFLKGNGSRQAAYVTADKPNKRIYVKGKGHTAVYDTTGRYLGIRRMPVDTSAFANTGKEYRVGKERFAAAAEGMAATVVSHPSMSLCAIRDHQGRLVACKRDADPELRDTTGSTVYVLHRIPQGHGYRGLLFYPAYQDTVYRAADDTIVPAYLVRTGNPPSFKKEALQKDGYRLSKGCRDLYALFETPRYLYLKYSVDGRDSVVRYEKSTGHTLRTGASKHFRNDLDGYGRLWPKFAFCDTLAAEYLTAGYIHNPVDSLLNIPALRDVGKDDNPVLAFIHLK